MIDQRRQTERRPAAALEAWSERRWILVILLAAGLATHFLWFGHPRELVFDEVHFGKFVTAYCCTGERFFDIHPPHAKLLIAGTAKLFGFSGGHSFAHIGQPYGEISPIGLRLVPAVTGVLLPVVFFILLLQLGASDAAALFGALLVLFDNALIVQTRIIALDGLLLLSILASLSMYLMAERSIRQRRATRRWVTLSLLTGGMAGLAVGAKFTGLAASGIIGVLWLYRVLTSRTRQELGRWVAAAVLMAAGAAVIYVPGWILHFALLQNPGGGDAWGVPSFESPIVLSFWREMTSLHRTMYEANNGLEAGHHDSSPWWSWPYMRTPVFYWQYSAPPDMPDDRVGALYFIGNPAVWWGSSALLVVVAVWLFIESLVRRSIRHVADLRLWIPIVGLIVAYVPLMRVARGLFMYHYLTPLLFVIALGVLWLDGHGWFRRGSVLGQSWSVYVAAGVVIVLFILFSPLTYGFLLPAEVQDQLFWMKTWR